MKSIVNISLITIVLVSLLSCATSGVPITKQAPPNNSTYQVDYLFEHEGCKVYRFLDHGEYIYFTNCTGEVSRVKADSSRSRVINVIKKTASE